MAMFIMVSCDNNDSFDDGKLSEKQVPKAVLAEFEEKYPDATNVTWARNMICMPLQVSQQADSRHPAKTIRHGLNGAKVSGT